jgi:hypothetical protein
LGFIHDDGRFRLEVPMRTFALLSALLLLAGPLGGTQSFAIPSAPDNPALAFDDEYGGGAYDDDGGSADLDDPDGDGDDEDARGPRDDEWDAEDTDQGIRT